MFVVSCTTGTKTCCFWYIYTALLHMDDVIRRSPSLPDWSAAMYNNASIFRVHIDHPLVSLECYQISLEDTYRFPKDWTQIWLGGACTNGTDYTLGGKNCSTEVGGNKPQTMVCERPHGSHWRQNMWHDFIVKNQNWEWIQFVLAWVRFVLTSAGMQDDYLGILCIRIG